jgi:D-cysteine desulfhydrase family pyridoxal phosphate-dependent enzyme
MTARPPGRVRFARVGLAVLPTPLDDAPRLTAALGGPRVLVKRDDLTGLALGGNKARKLDLLAAQARAAGADILVTGGGLQSNHARMTAAAANRIGVGCHLVLAAPEPDTASGNLLLDRLLGATLEFGASSRYEDLERAIGDAADRLGAAGRRPFAIPVGGASVVGVVAYADAVDELRAQLDGDAARSPHWPDWMVVADGSGGTHAGILAGLGDTTTRVIGVDVGARTDLDEAVPRLAIEAAESSGRARPTAQVIVDHDHVGSGYAEPTREGFEAMTIAAHTEGLVLDPVYTGKAMAALVTRIRDGRIGAHESVVFWHTGGAPALFDPRYAPGIETGAANRRE